MEISTVETRPCGPKLVVQSLWSIVRGPEFVWGAITFYHNHDQNHTLVIVIVNLSVSVGNLNRFSLLLNPAKGERAHLAAA